MTATLSNALHGQQTIFEGIHSIVSYVFADAVTRLTSSLAFIPADIYKVAYQADNESLWVLINTASSLWIPLNGSGSSFSGTFGADSAPSYLLLFGTSSLPNQRMFSVSGSSGLTGTDNGPGNIFFLSINDNIVATLTGSTFSGPVFAAGGLTGSLQQVAPGIPYLLSQGSITLITKSNGQVIISGSTVGNTTNINVSGGDPLPSYLILNSTASLPNERVFNVSGTSGLKATDTGPNGTLSLAIDNSVVATISGSTFTGATIHNGGLSGSLQRLPSGQTYIAGAGSVSVTTSSSGQVVISSPLTSDVSASYVTIGNTGSLPNERALVAGTGLTLVDAGAGSTVSLGINNNVVATLSGSVFTGVVSASAGLSGSLQQVGPGIPYLLSQGSITITTMSNGQVIISGSSVGSTTNINVSGGDPGPSYLVLNTTASLSSERVFSVSGSSGLKAIDSGPNGTLSLSIDNSVVATLTGSVFTGPVSASAGLSGSLQQVAPGLSYLVAGNLIAITSQSNGQIIVASTASTTDVSASYVTIGNTGSLPNERSLAAGTGLTLVDGGAGSSVTLGINNNVVATLSGSVFTGVVSASAGLSGSLQQVGPGIPYLLSQGSITITTMSNGQVVISGSSAGSTTNINVSGGDPGPSYLVLNTTASLSNERVFSVSGSSGLKATDSGANGTLTLSIDNSIVATLTGSTFTGPVSASAGFSGSLQQVGPGLSYLVAGYGVSIISQSNGQIVVSSSVAPYAGTAYVDPAFVGTSTGSPSSPFTTIAAAFAALVAAGVTKGIVFIPPNSSITENVVFPGVGSWEIASQEQQGGIIATINGTVDVSITSGVSTTLTRRSLTNVLVTGAVTGNNASSVAARLKFVNTSLGTSLTLTGTSAWHLSMQSNSSGFTSAGSVLTITTPGEVYAQNISFNSPVSVGVSSQFINCNFNAGTSFITTGAGLVKLQFLNIADPLSNFPANITFTAASGSCLIQVDGASAASLIAAGSTIVSGSIQYIHGFAAGNLIAFTTQSNGQVVISSIPSTDVSASYVTIGNTGSLPNERALVAGTGLTLVDGGAGSSVTLGINNSVVATLSGSVFTGPISASAGLSGSLQQVGPGIPYLLSQGSITLTTMSNGQVIISGSSAGSTTNINVSGGDPGPSYLVLNTTASLSSERVLNVSGTSGLKAIDSGPNGTLSLSIDNSVVATLSGSVFTGPVSASAGLSGSLQQVGPNLSYLVAGNLIAITTQSNGQVVVSSIASTTDVSASFVTIGNTGSLPNERALTAGSGLTLVDGGANSTVTLGINNNVVATVSGTTFTGVVSASAGLSGSLQQVGPGIPYLLSQGSITITTMSNGQVIISGSSAISTTNINVSGGDPGPSYLVLNTTASLSSERVLNVSGSSGLKATDSGPNGTLSLSIDNSVVATLTGSVFTGPVSASAGLSGSLQQVGPGLSYLVAGNLIAITSQSNGQIVVSSIASTTDVSASYVTIGNTGSLPNERSLTAGTGLVLTDAGANSTVTLGINNNVVATLSGSVFTGVVSASAGLSGSLQQVGPGIPYLLSQGSITITTMSNGQVIISGSSAGSTTNINVSGGDPGPSYLVLNTTASLSSERVFSVSGTSGLRATDTGPNGSLSLSIDNSVVATLSGSVFTGPVSASAGLSGSLQQVAPGLSYLVAGNLIAITSQSNGQIIVASTASTTDVSASYVTIGNTGSLPNERSLTAGTGLTLVDGGAGASVTLGINNNVVATLSGSIFTGVVSASAGLSGSLQQVGPGIPYLLSQGSITITTMSNGQVVISGSSVGSTNISVSGGDPGPSYLVLNTTASLSNERVFSVSGSSGLKTTDSGPNGTLSLSIDNSVVATLSGSVFSGPVSASAGLSGSLQQVAPGLSYLVAGANVTVTSQSNGQVVIASTGADVSASYVTIGNTGSLPNERALTTGTGLNFSDGGAGGNVSLSVNPAVVAMITGATFTGPVQHTGGLSGSLQQVSAGVSYLVAGANITVTSQSNGQVIIASTATGGSGADVSASYVTIGNTGSLPNERSLTAGVGVILTDGGANSTVSLGINNNVVATLSGSVFTGVVSASAGLSGSLQQVGPGIPYLLSQGSITITTMSNGQIIISGSGTGGGGGGSGTGGGDPGASYLTLGNTGSLSNERQFVPGQSLSATDAGSNSTYTLNFNNALSGTLTASNHDVSNAKAVTFFGEFNAGLSSGSFTIDWNNGQKQFITLTAANVTASFIAPVAGVGNYQLRVIQDSTGSRSIANYPATTLWSFGQAPNLTPTPGGIDILSFFYNSSSYYGAANLAFSGSGVPYLIAGPNVAFSSSAGSIVISFQPLSSGIRIVDSGLVSLNPLSSATLGPYSLLTGETPDATVFPQNLGPDSLASWGGDGAADVRWQFVNHGISDPTTQFEIAIINDGIVSQSCRYVVSALNPSGTNYYIGTMSDPGASYLLLSGTASLGSARKFVPGTSMVAVDGGLGQNYTLGFNNALSGTLTASNRDVANVKAVTFNGEFNNGTIAGGTFTWNLNNGQKQVVTLASNTTASISGSFAGIGNFLLRVIQDNTGSRGLLVSGAKYPGGTVPTWSTVTGSVDILSCYWNGITPYCQAGIGFA